MPCFVARPNVAPIKVGKIFERFNGKKQKKADSSVSEWNERQSNELKNNRTSVRAFFTDIRIVGDAMESCRLDWFVQKSKITKKLFKNQIHSFSDSVDIENCKPHLFLRKTSSIFLSPFTGWSLCCFKKTRMRKQTPLSSLKAVKKLKSENLIFSQNSIGWKKWLFTKINELVYNSFGWLRFGSFELVRVIEVYFFLAQVFSLFWSFICFSFQFLEMPLLFSVEFFFLARRVFNSVVGVFPISWRCPWRAPSSSLQSWCLVKYKFQASTRCGSRRWRVQIQLLTICWVSWDTR